MFRTLGSVLRFQRFEADPVERRLGAAASVAGLRRIAKRRLPGGVFDYIDGAAEDERTMTANQEAFARMMFRPRVLRDVETVDVASSLLGRSLAYPLVLAPTGFTRIADPQGELAVARAAERAGLPYTLSTLSTRSIEEVRAASDGRLWFQVYAWRDRGLVKEMADRAAGARYEALVLTVDTAVLGRRERDVRRGFSLPPSIGRAPWSTARCTRRGRGRSCAAIRSVSRTSRAARSATAGRRSRCRTTSTPSSIPRFPGPMSTGCVRSGTARSSSRAFKPWTMRCSRPSAVSTPSPCPTTAGASSTEHPPPSHS